MALSLHNLKPARGAKRRSKRLGRGNASGKGTYSGKGLKGQRARQGGRKGLVQFGVKHFVARLPKVRGFKSFRATTQTVTLSELNVFKDGAQVTVNSLWRQGLIKRKNLPVKLIGQDKLKTRLAVELPCVSRGARASIEGAGGSVKIIKNIT